MIKTFKVSAELFMSADRVVTLVVYANTERKAKIFAKDELMKKYNTDMVRVISIDMII